MSRLSCVQSCLCPDLRLFINVSRRCNFENTTPPAIVFFLVKRMHFLEGVGYFSARIDFLHDCVHFGLDISTFGLGPQPGLTRCNSDSVLIYSFIDYLLWVFCFEPFDGDRSSVRVRTGSSIGICSQNTRFALAFQDF